MTDFTGTTGDDHLTGTNGRDVFDLSQGGDDTVSALKGDDVFLFGGAFKANDRIDGGDGYDEVRLNANYPSPIVFTADTLRNVEQLSLEPQHVAWNLTTVDANVAAGKTLAINDYGSDGLVFDGSAETDGNFAISLSFLSHNDYVTGGAGNDIFDLTDVPSGGSHIVYGGAGNDRFDIFAGLPSSHQIDGGAGTDTLMVHGFWGQRIFSFANTSVVGIERVTFVAGSQDNGPVQYGVTGSDAMVAPGATLTIDGSNLSPTDELTFDGSAESDGRLSFIAGPTSTIFIGGSGNDSFDLTRASFASASGGDGEDTFDLGAALNPGFAIDGGRGSDTLVLRGDYSAGLAFGPATVTNIKTIVLGPSFSYDLATDDATVAAGKTLKLDGSALGLANTLIFDGSAETDGRFAMFGGSGDDALTGASLGDRLSGAAGSDTLYGGAGNDRLKGGDNQDTLAGGEGADRLAGGGGADIFVYQTIGHSPAGPAWDGTVAGLDIITDFHAHIRKDGTPVADHDTIDLSAIDADTTLNGDQAFHISNGLTGTPGDLYITSDGAGHTLVEGDVDGDQTPDFVVALNDHNASLLLTMNSSDFVL